MEIGRLRSIGLLKQAGKLIDLSAFGAAVALAGEHQAATNLGDWGEFPSSVRSRGRAAASELLNFFQSLPNLAGAKSHLHFATGLAEPEIVVTGSAAEASAVTWSNQLSQAVALASFDFTSVPLHPPDSAKAKFDELAALLDHETDMFIAERLRLFGFEKS